LKTIAKIIVPLVLLQSALAPVYVPIIFGYKWVEQGAIPVLIFICLSALSRPFADANSLMFRAVGKPQIELYWNILFTAILTLTIWLGTGWGILGAAIAVMLTHACLQPIYTIWATRFVLARLA
jgi:PST family polysaccharide transporter